jgi:glyoxylase-like metal-dependent hydrolase (beta-lactamase superfamily II)
VLEPIDLEFLGLRHAIGVYLVETDDGLALHDCGPATSLAGLHRGLARRGLELGDIRHLLLSHIHFDHAGAAGQLVRESPGLTVWVSEVGAPHLIDPTRLEASARRLYGDRFDALFGGLVPIPAENIAIADGDVLGWEAFPAPGHATHQVAYFRDGTLLPGDACGARILPATFVYPVAPPPDIDVEAWHRTIAEIEVREPRELALIHFGVATDVEAHLERLVCELDRWAELVRDGITPEAFADEVRRAAGPDDDLYGRIAPAEQSWLGLRRYWDKRADRAEVRT